jgi:hypothetical protein
MIRERSNILPAKENQERRQFGHLRLLVSETPHVGIQPREGPINLQREGEAPRALVTSENFMPKRQHNRNDKATDTTEVGIPRPGASAKASEPPTIKREFMLTPLADESLFAAVRALSKATGSTLSNSHFLRIMLKVVANAMPEIEREASRLGTLDRPSNARDNQAAREEFEQKIAEAVAAALHSCPPLGLDTGTSRKGSGTTKRPS